MLVFFISNLKPLLDSSPVADIDLDEFKDDWDYQTLPGKTPILDSGEKQHDLPPASNRQVSTLKIIQEF